MLSWQKLKVSAIYKPVQKLTGIKFSAGANLMPFFFCNQGSKHTHKFSMTIAKAWGVFQSPLSPGFHWHLPFFDNRQCHSERLEPEQNKPCSPNWQHQMTSLPGEAFPQVSACTSLCLYSGCSHCQVQHIITTFHCIDGTSSKSKLDILLPLPTTETKKVSLNLWVNMEKIIFSGDHSHHIFLFLLSNWM